MNRIVLIGNGFDLSHGLKTSYRDFIDDYWMNIRHHCISNLKKSHEDDDIKIEYIPRGWPEKDCYKYLMSRQVPDKFKVHFKNRFLERISKINGEMNWVDIENEYYQLLKEAYRNKEKTKYEIKSLNKDFLVIQNYLEEYLTKIENDIDNLFHSRIFNMLRKINFLSENLTSPFKNQDFEEQTRFQWESLKATKKGHEFVPDNLLILNFNYTSTPDLYLSKIKEKIEETTHIHIHGKLNDNNNKMIFGFGDELDDDYKEIENLNDNEFLGNIKSIRYLESRVYKDLLNFIHADKYQIFILGHSCGNSDRTLLNTLFEHPNCASIKPFYREKENGEDNYSDIVRNISRSFKDKATMRDRVVNKSFCHPFSNS